MSLAIHMLYRFFHILCKDPSIRRANYTFSLNGLAHISSSKYKLNVVSSVKMPYVGRHVLHVAAKCNINFISKL
jgi:hypothetical protein